ncbi:hypothetical protein JTB14_027937 [Gonioctena quinquepunctata]|nr:hypothetical protein JTB14_027937 [Gonioctena quinquepunctata]
MIEFERYFAAKIAGASSAQTFTPTSSNQQLPLFNFPKPVLPYKWTIRFSGDSRKVKSYGPSPPLENSTFVQTVMSRIRKSERLSEKAMQAAGDTRRSDHNQEEVSPKRSMVANNLEDKTSARESLNVNNKKNNSEHGQSRYGSKKTLFCYGCGKKGITKVVCYKCNPKIANSGTASLDATTISLTDPGTSAKVNQRLTQ